MRGALPSAEAQVAALAAALAPRHRWLRCEVVDGRLVRLDLRRGGRTVGVAIAVDLVVLAPTEALAAELESHIAALGVCVLARADRTPRAAARRRRRAGSRPRGRARALLPQPETGATAASEPDSSTRLDARE